MDKELDKVRKNDETAYRCVGCQEIKSGWGARLLSGWVCSNKCWDDAIARYYAKHKEGTA